MSLQLKIRRHSPRDVKGLYAEQIRSFQDFFSSINEENTVEIGGQETRIQDVWRILRLWNYVFSSHLLKSCLCNYSLRCVFLLWKCIQLWHGLMSSIGGGGCVQARSCIISSFKEIIGVYLTYNVLTIAKWTRYIYTDTYQIISLYGPSQSIG